MTQQNFPAKKEWIDKALVNNAQYLEKYRQSIENPNDYWKEEAKLLDWYKFPSKIKNTSFNDKNPQVKWFEDGELNVSVNCIDRHLPQKAQQTAFIWEGDEPTTDKKVTYQELHDEVCRLANALKKLGIKKGDRVALYMPMVLEAAFAMLACSRIGAVHAVVFGGFSPQALASRINDTKAKILITADSGMRGGKEVPLKDNADTALEDCPSVEKCIVLKHTSTKINWNETQDLWYRDIVNASDKTCEPEKMNAEDPLFILYTSGSTGTPKGMLHTTGGYLLYAASTFRYIFNYTANDTFWCTADVGWVMGHSYVVYAPLVNGGTSVMFEGVPNYPDVSRFWQIVDKHQVNMLYTAPTVIRAVMREGDEPVKKTSRKSLKLMATAGEPINPEAWLWFHDIVGNGNCPLLDTWWQTETGAAILAPLPGATTLKPGSVSLPMFGVEITIMDKNGQEITGEGSGSLVFSNSWPGQARSVYGNPQRYLETYFSEFPGYFVTGDGARRDEDGYFWITGRIDDVLNVAGHRLGTAEIESALVSHPTVAEAAVVGTPHEIKGSAIYCFVTLKVEVEPSDELKKELIGHVRKALGPIASPDVIQWAPALPKTRSGKIMRRILRKVAENDTDNLGDISTLAEPAVVESLVKDRENIKQ